MAGDLRTEARVFRFRLLCGEIFNGEFCGIFCGHLRGLCLVAVGVV
jgi:hypothetical protein